MSVVSFVHVRRQGNNALKEGIRKSLELIHFCFKENVTKIVIKPNMCYYFHPSTGEVTDPLFVDALIDVFRENFPRDPEIVVVESDASAMKCRYAFVMLGYENMAKEKNVKLINLVEQEKRLIDITVNSISFKFHVPEIFYDSDLIVNVPKIKYMNDVKVTCALKNMFGCNAYSSKYVYHKTIHEAVVGINRLIRTDVVVVDGLVVRGAQTRRLDLIMSSKDPVANDAAASTLMGIAPKSIRHIVLASKNGIGDMEFSPIGDFAYFRGIFPKKTLKHNIRDRLASVYLRIFK